MKIKQPFRVVELLALACAVFLVVTLSVQKREIEQAYLRAREVAFSAYPGMYVPHLSVEDVGGQRIAIGAPNPGHFQALFFLRTDCEFSVASLPAWERAQRDISNLGHEAIGISFDSLEASRAFAQKHELGFPLVPLPDERVAGIFRVSGVPLTLVVDDKGRVVHTRRRQFTQPAADSLISFLKEISNDLDALEGLVADPPTRQSTSH